MPAGLSVKLVETNWVDTLVCDLFYLLSQITFASTSTRAFSAMNLVKSKLRETRLSTVFWMICLVTFIKGDVLDEVDAKMGSPDFHIFGMEGVKMTQSELLWKLIKLNS